MQQSSEVYSGLQHITFFLRHCVFSLHLTSSLGTASQQKTKKKLTPSDQHACWELGSDEETLRAKPFVTRSSARGGRQVKVAAAAMRPTTMHLRGPSGSTAVTATTTGARMSVPRPPVPQGLPSSPGAVVSRVALLCGVCLAVLTQCPAVSAGPVPSGGGGYLDANLLVDTRIESIGMCRVLCLKKFSLPPTNRSKPKTKQHLEECWNMCENLFRNPKVYLSLCNTTSCYFMDGCQVACTFQKLSRAATNLTWTFGTEVQSKTDNSVLTITWDPPTPSVPVPAPHPIVYTLLLRENDDAWRVLTQTSEHQYKTHSGQALWVPSFVLQAIDDTGIIASRSFDVKGFKYEKVYEVENIPAPPTLRQHEHLQAAVNVTYALSYDVKGGLEATLTWTHPASSSKSAVSGEELLDYELVYIMQECGIHQDRLPPEVPACHSPEDLFDASVPVRRRETAEYTIGELLFSSRYDVTLNQKLGNLKTVVLARLVLETPFCQAPSIDYLFCDHPPQLLASPQPSPSADDVSANVTQVIGGVSEEPLAMELDLIRDLRLELLPLPEAWSRQSREWGDSILGEADEYWTEGEAEEEERERLLFNVTWTYISDVSQVNFSLTLQLLEEDRTMTDVVEVSGATHVTAALLDNAVYEILIELIAPPETKGESGALFHSPGSDQTKNYISHSRQVRVFNTSELRLAASERHEAVKMSTDKNLRAVNGAIIGVTCVGAVLAVTVLGLFLYKKRQSFKDIIVPKTTVAKSNSYKSSVGVKTDYSNQLMVFCDEWELDPQQLKFSTPLGQGAFGKVVTGYYMDHRVAIKLVKEGAPLSYKEDLVAEINLMKRLGAHPNIVCLVGACTVTEPIALVMEYVPFGNLQNFLKKCRLEGDLQKREDGPSEIQYSVLQDCGGIENGVITPTDMLSFARQVAMAMEYLAEKKYVHRDLAARNVLLHFNKVVKVCDFGLSRDIFNDNQYKKLTNGKLPLKWMAIESLRDRIFTTHSDVWSFGILLWEIVTMGASPYPSIALADLYYVLSNHYRMGRPSNCSNELYGLMRSCWAENPQERPTFTEVRERLEELMAEDRDYLILEDIDVPLSASESSSNPTVPELFSGELLPSHAARQVVTASCSSCSSSSSAHTDSASSVSAGLLRPRHLPVNVVAGLAAGSGQASCSGAVGAAAGGGDGAGVSGSSSCGTSTATTSAGLALSSGRRPPMTIDVCVHQKSTERLVRPSESDSSPWLRLSQQQQQRQQQSPKSSERPVTPRPSADSGTSATQPSPSAAAYNPPPLIQAQQTPVKIVLPRLAWPAESSV